MSICKCGGRCLGFSVRGNFNYIDFEFHPDDWLLFGSETAGLPANVLSDCKDLVTQGADKSMGMPKTPEMPKAKGGGEASKVTGSKSTTINIQIGKLIEQFKVSTTTVGEGAGQIKEKVAQALLGAINDSQIVAGI